MSRSIYDVPDVPLSTAGVGEEVQMFLSEELSPKGDFTPIRTKVQVVSVYELTVCEARSRNGLGVIHASRDDRGTTVFKYVFTDFAGEEQYFSVAVLFRFTPDRHQLLNPYFIDPNDVVQFGYFWRGERPPC